MVNLRGKAAYRHETLGRQTLSQVLRASARCVSQVESACDQGRGDSLWLWKGELVALSQEKNSREALDILRHDQDKY